MSDENFRRDLNQVFDEVAGSPSSNLRHRVRSAVTATPEGRGGPYWIAAIAAAAIAILLVGVLVVSGPLRGSNSPVGGAHATASPSPIASPSAPDKMPAFACGSGSTTTFDGGPQTAYVGAIRNGTQSGYDTVTIEFANGVPSDVQVGAATSGTTFTLSPSGMEVTLKGDHGILVTIHGSDLHTSYTGSTDIVTGDPTIAEVRRVQDFEGVVQLGLGINGAGCYRAYWLTNPDRLVIDVQGA